MITFVLCLIVIPAIFCSSAFNVPSDAAIRFNASVHTIPAGFEASPDILLLGCAKCASTSLYHLLSEHPSICPSREKEKHYFDGFNWDLGVKWYTDQFANNCKSRKDKPPSHYADGTPSYIYANNVPPRIYKSYSKDDRDKLKFLIVLREPMDREYSWYRHQIRACTPSMRHYMEQNKDLAAQVAAGNATWDVHELCAYHGCPKSCLTYGARAQPNQEFKAFGNFTEYWRAGGIVLGKDDYAAHLEEWFKYFNPEQFFIVSMVTLLHNTTDTAERMTRFLDIPPFPHRMYVNGKILLPEDNENHLPTTYDCAVRNALFPHHEANNQRLYALLDQRPRNVTHEPPFVKFVQKFCAPGQLY